VTLTMVNQQYPSLPWFYSRTGSIIAAFLVHSKLDYCKSLYYNLPKSQINYLQPIQNCLARIVIKATKFSHITPYAFVTLNTIQYNL